MGAMSTRSTTGCVRAALLFLALAFVPLWTLADDDADRARDGVKSGEYLPLEQILRDALARYPGLVVEVELDDDEYEIEVLMDDGAKIELEYDARTGELLDVDLDD